MFDSQKTLPFLRWSFWRMAFAARHIQEHWQVGDGREEKLAAWVAAHARPGDAADVLRVIDEFGYRESFLMNVGDVKGRILDAALARVAPRNVLELGTYCGYSALRMAIAVPAARIVSVEFNAANAAVARRVHAHAGVSRQIEIVVGTLGDGGATIRSLEASHGLAQGSVDFVFIDHDKNAYLSDLKLILERGWLHPGTVVVADNVKFPGVPEYLAYMRENEGKSWRTVEHATHVEYQTFFEDLVLVSERIGESIPS